MEGLAGKLIAKLLALASQPYRSQVIDCAPIRSVDSLDGSSTYFNTDARRVYLLIISPYWLLLASKL